VFVPHLRPEKTRRLVSNMLFFKREPYQLLDKWGMGWKGYLVGVFVGGIGGVCGAVLMQLAFGPQSTWVVVPVSSLSGLFATWLFWYFA
jgi:hypothetical protein